ncbi:MAG TPA: HEPN domain-containing protein [Anaerolineae bacterium]|nr:HEPN domain-containing protein [Anaerolineae bacterium]
MTNHELMWAWLEEAEHRLIEARTWLEQAWYHRVVCLSQESCELAQKALLAFYGMDVPKEHHLHKLVGQQPPVRQLPRQVQRRLFQSGQALSRDRIPSFYGAPDGTPPQALYDAKRAQEALEQAHFVIETVKALIEAAGGQTRRPEE